MSTTTPPSATKYGLRSQPGSYQISCSSRSKFVEFGSQGIRATHDPSLSLSLRPSDNRLWPCSHSIRTDYAPSSELDSSLSSLQSFTFINHIPHPLSIVTLFIVSCIYMTFMSLPRILLIIVDIVFHVIILIIDAFLERRDRQMFELREQLKTQFVATQRAQQAEKQAADLKKRFASYSESLCVSLLQAV